jgi:hypothetical protein
MGASVAINPPEKLASDDVAARGGPQVLPCAWTLHDCPAGKTAVQAAVAQVPYAGTRARSVGLITLVVQEQVVEHQPHCTAAAQGSQDVKSAQGSVHLQGGKHTETF